MDSLEVPDYNAIIAVSRSLSEGPPMASMTIHNLDDDLKNLLRLRAAQHGTSMEEVARSILHAALFVPVEDNSGAALYAAIRAIVEPFGGIELDLPVRGPQPEPLDFGE